MRPQPQVAAERRKARGLLRDARRHHRQRMFLPGKLVFPGHALDCLIADLSLGGARVRGAKGKALPVKLWLIHLKERFAYEVRVAWRRADGSVGLQFLRSFNLDGATTPELRMLR